MEAFEANSIMLRLKHLRENLEELDRKFGWFAVNAKWLDKSKDQMLALSRLPKEVPWWLKPHYGIIYKNQFERHHRHR
ncbi:UNVERIFIED_CONTAM: hypothetical protein Sradi_3642000 [Sesamum radiatum]|uniref:Uncharacterized protein n=1 Tax=Sesamum radiatum TaxID=300843 RepID=A0AAW2QI88_SESRA